MAVWIFEGIRRLRKPEVQALEKRVCLIEECGGRLQRIAFRVLTPPYQWIPTGHVCSICNTMYMGVG